jgi:predicted SnoaL-like aldol condensation-catalyzing enzyme
LVVGADGREDGGSFCAPRAGTAIFARLPGSENQVTDLETNKRTVVSYYQMAFDGNPEHAVAEYFGDRYIQHNPDGEDGPDAFIGYVHYLRSEYPELQLEIKRVIAEGDLVATHSHLILKPGEPGRALADFFRLENGKVVEHWDVIQEVPENSANSNGMF